MRTIVVLLVLFHAVATPLHGQDAVPRPAVLDSQPPFRDPVVARTLGTVFPGAGHIYAGEYLHGVRYYYGTLSGIGGGAIALAVSGMRTDKAPAWPLKVAGVLAIGIGVGVWVRSALDAPRAAERANVRHRAAVRHVSLVLQPRRGAAPGANVAVDAGDSGAGLRDYIARRPSVRGDADGTPST